MYVDPTLGHVIEAVAKNEKGEITGYKLENGEIIMKEQAVMMAKQGAVKGVSVSISKKGEEFLKSLPDNDSNNNLKNLPIVGQNEKG